MGPIDNLLHIDREYLYIIMTGEALMERRVELGGVAGMEDRCTCGRSLPVYTRHAAQLYGWKCSLDQVLKGPAS
jgi:hypothetical protein